MNSAARRSPDHGLLALSEPTLDAVFWAAERIACRSPWWVHVPFGHWIIAAARPMRLLEIGTGDGVSFATFCQAVLRANVPAHCYAIASDADTFPAGSASVELEDTLNNRFGALATVLKSPLHHTHDNLDDGSIDLLHIDGYHIADATEQVYTAWQRKLSENAVVLLHGVNDLSAGGSVRRLWRNLSEQYPSFEFTHGRGLGVLAVGISVPEPIRLLCDIKQSEQIGILRNRFSQLGERWAIEAREEETKRNLNTLSGNIIAREASLAELLAKREDDIATVAELKVHVEQAERTLAQARADAAQARLDANRDILAQKARSEEAREEAARTREDVLQLIETTRKQSDQDRIDSARLADAAMERVEARHRSEKAQLRSEIDAAEQAAGQLQIALQAAQERFDQVESERAAILRSELHRTNLQYTELEAQLTMLRSSTAWKLTWPLRKVGDRSPLWLRRCLRRILKLAWRIVTLRLRSGDRTLATPAAALLPPQSATLKDRVQSQVRASFLNRTPTASASPSTISARSIRLVYVSGEAHTPGHAYRVERFVSTALELGHWATAITPAQILARIDDIARAQILVLWRTTWCDEVEQAVAAARKVGARIVFDVDDLMLDPEMARVDIIDGIRSSALTEEQVRLHFAAVQRCMLEADVCFTTTEELALHMRGQGKRTHVLPNGFDRVSHAVARRAQHNWQKAERDSVFRIGYAAGSRTHQRDFGYAAEAIARLMREMPHVRLVLFRTPDGLTPLLDVFEFPALVGLEDRIEWRSLQPIADLPNELARFDVNVVPLEFGNPFCEAKSELKFWEAALVQVPTIASPTGPFRRAICHGKTGFLAASADDWYYQLKRLAEDAELRRTVARNANYAAMSSFGPIDRKLRFSRVIEQLAGGQAGANAFALDTHLASQPKRRIKVFPSEVVFHKPAATMADVTVVVPLYNYEQYVIEALDSVAAQTLGVLDLVVVEGCSTDNSLEVAKAWVERNAPRFNRLLLLRNRSNYGLAFCRNSGFDAADTPYVIPLDADNRLRRNCCETLLAAIRETGSAYAYPSIQLFGDSAAIIGNFPYDPKGFVPSNYIDAMAMVDREAWAFVGGYEHVRHGWEDYDFWCRLAETGLGGSWCPQVLAEYRIHNKSIIRTLHEENYLRLFDDFTTRHPWVVLGEQQTARRAPPSRPYLTPSGQKTRLDTVLPLLRCPESHEKLVIDDKREVLIELGGLRRWPIADGRPILTRDAALHAAMGEEPRHAALLPQHAVELARSTEDFVLHLNAGWARIGLENVITVDSAIYPNTDIVADAHNLPFDDESLGAVILCSGLHQFSNSSRVIAEIRRVLKVRGQIFIQTPFLQADDRSSPHFFHATRSGLETWMKGFQTDLLRVPDHLKAHRTFARLAADVDAGLKSDVSAAAAARFRSTEVQHWIEHEHDAPQQNDESAWAEIAQLSEQTEERLAAGFEFLGHKGEELPDLKAPGRPA